MKSLRIAACFIGLMSISCIGMADAKAEIVFNTGEEVTLQYFFNNSETPNASLISEVSGAVEFVDFAGFGINFDFSKNFLRLDFTLDSILNPSFSHVFKIVDESNTIADFEAVFISDGSSQVFLDSLADPALFSVTSVDEISLNLSGLDYEPGLTLQFEFNDGLAAVPEPGSFAVLGLAAAGIWSRKRWKNRAGRVKSTCR